jgi:hypothetical protein
MKRFRDPVFKKIRVGLLRPHLINLIDPKNEIDWRRINFGLGLELELNSTYHTLRNSLYS